MAGSMFHSMCWNSQTESLAALQYTNLIVWYDPLLLLNDQILVRKSLEKIDLRFGGEFLRCLPNVLLRFINYYKV